MLQSQEATLREKEQAEVEAILLSLARSPLMGRLFSYICRKYFNGESGHLNEIRIAQEVFGRTESFDRSQDAIARVEAHRLRKKLKHYYETSGKEHSVQIELPAGSYVPVFRHMGASEEYSTVRAVPQNGLPLSNGDLAQPVPPVETPALEKMIAPSLTEVVTPPTKWVQWAVYGGVAAAMALALFAVWRSNARPENATAISAPITAKPAGAWSPGTMTRGPTRFLCGYEGPPHIDRVGRVWGADQYFHGGRPWPARRRFLRGTSDPFLFENMRTGEFSYDIPAQPGPHELHLYFVETGYGEDLGGGENSRTFLIRLNGETLFQTFDPLADAGGPWIADERVFKDVAPAPDGMVHVSFESQRGQPMISAIELLPGIPHKQLPIRLVTQVSSYTDHAGLLWAPDNFYTGGQIFGDKPEVTDTPDPGLFRTERAGNFRYAIPVDVHGTYTARLEFAETYFGSGASGIGGVGNRVFNVMCNGVYLLDHFDIFAQAGSVTAVEKTFHGLKSNAQGKLLFWFEPVANYASVFGIEVLDESR